MHILFDAYIRKIEIPASAVCPWKLEILSFMYEKQGKLSKTVSYLFILSNKTAQGAISSLFILKIKCGQKDSLVILWKKKEKLRHPWQSQDICLVMSIKRFFNKFGTCTFFFHFENPVELIDLTVAHVALPLNVMTCTIDLSCFVGAYLAI